MANNEISILSNSEEIQNFINADPSLIDEAMYQLLQENNHEEIVRELDEDWFEGY